MRSIVLVLLVQLAKLIASSSASNRVSTSKAKFYQRQWVSSKYQVFNLWVLVYNLAYKEGRVFERIEANQSTAQTRASQSEQ